MVDLARKLPLGTKRLRIWTNLALYWDSIAVDLSAPPLSVPAAGGAFDSAQLGFRGFSGFLRPQARLFAAGALRYQRVHYNAPWASSLEGTYTRYGDVRAPLGLQE